jgi:hypothetical protein
MIEQLLNQFAGSSEAGSAIQELVAKGLSPEKAKDAVVATAQGAKEAAASSSGLGGLGALAGMFGGGGGGGGLMGALGGPMVDQIVLFVSTKVGIDASTAKMVVDVVLPKVLSLVQQKGDLLAGGGNPGGSVGGLGGLFG